LELFHPLQIAAGLGVSILVATKLNITQQCRLWLGKKIRAPPIFTWNCGNHFLELIPSLENSMML
jgi:hypothetical protein